MGHEPIQFKERSFLGFFLNQYRKKHGDNIQHLSDYKFSPADMIEFDEAFGLLEPGTDNFIAHRIEYSKWFKEAFNRGLIESKDNGFNYTLSKKGYTMALKYDHPIQHFFEKRWEVYVAKILVVIATFATVIGAIFTVLQYYKGE